MMLRPSGKFLYGTTWKSWYYFGRMRAPPIEDLMQDLLTSKPGLGQSWWAEGGEDNLSRPLGRKTSG